MSSVIDYTDRATCPIFGDGAAAFMLEPTREDMGVMDAVLRTDGKGLPFYISKQEVPYVLHLTIHWTIGCIIFIRKDVQSLNMLWPIWRMLVRRSWRGIT